MIVVERSGKSVDEAVNRVLKEYNVDKENVIVEVLETGNKGFLGILGNKQARVKVMIKTPLDYVKDFLDNTIEKMNLEVSYELKQEGDLIKADFTGYNVGLLIGKRGENLDSLQYLCNLVANKFSNGKHVRVLLDAENYRSKREESLRQLAYRMAKKVVETGRNIALEPMSSYERKIIHLALQDNPDVETYSLGEEPYRKVIIALK